MGDKRGGQRGNVPGRRITSHTTTVASQHQGAAGGGAGVSGRGAMVARHRLRLRIRRSREEGGRLDLCADGARPLNRRRSREWGRWIHTPSSLLRAGEPDLSAPEVASAFASAKPAVIALGTRALNPCTALS
ncbi:hypothetical protein OsI_27080 [Oryza sativa Indica Group]|uniref:Uncharacterized protein n=1 Tax=Oryza sativa subsp. indica TaxID=39946 RepID=A2YP87_ORYSI|nr:hypothetical protein OsI_27080 [Oryza sativa Indica Group]